MNVNSHLSQLIILRFFQCKVKIKICIMQYSTRSIEWYYFHVHAYDFSTYFVMFQLKLRKTDMIGEYSFDLLSINEFYSVFSFQRYQDHSLILPPSGPVIFLRAMVRSRLSILAHQVSVTLETIFRCVLASLQEGVSVRPSVRRSVRLSPIFFRSYY